MMVARHEMPGKRLDTIRPVGNGLIRCARPCPPSNVTRARRDRSYRTLRDGLLDAGVQAFHAWLPSFSPSGASMARPRSFPALPLVPGAPASSRRSR
jgi:hypothetical protein